MAKARERLMQLGLAQREAEEFASKSREVSQLPPGGEVKATRLIRPSQAEDIDARTTPLVDFAEFFLNQIGISSPRQVRATQQQIIAGAEANTVMLDAAKEKLQLVARRSGGFDMERLQATAIRMEKAAALMDNEDPSFQEFGRTELQIAVNELDQITLDQSEYINKQRDRIQGQVDNILDAGRAEELESATIVGLLNERGNREGTTSKLSVTEKQVLAAYLGGSNFSQKISTEGIIPSLSVPFDPSEQITVGDATVLVQAARKTRKLVLADQLGDINATAVGSGFNLADEDGVLKVHEIISPPIGQDVERLRHGTPAGQPLNIKPGIPTAEGTKEVAASIPGRIGAGATGFVGALPGVKPLQGGITNLLELFDPGEIGRAARERLNKSRETN